MDRVVGALGVHARESAERYKVWTESDIAKRKLSAIIHHVTVLAMEPDRNFEEIVVSFFYFAEFGYQLRATEELEAMVK